MFEPQRREAFCDYLVAQNDHGKAAAELAKCLEDNDFVSPSGKSKHQLWMRLCDLCAAHPEELPSVVGRRSNHQERFISLPR